MTVRLCSFILICLLVTGCGGTASPRTLSDESQVQHADEQTRTLDPDTGAALKQNKTPLLSETEIAVNPSASVSPPGMPVPSAAASPVPAPSVPPEAAASPVPSPVTSSAPQVSKQPASPKPKKASPRPETVKKPALPAQQAQGQARAYRKRLSLSELVTKYPQVFKLHGAVNEKKVALTFDDGPDTRFTPQVLDALKTNHVKATFFLLGSKANEHPDIVRRIVREGHVIGNHSHTHANLPKLPPDKFQQQIEQAETALQGLTGYAPKLIRPPYGAINEEQVLWMAEHRYLIVNWNVDSLDWKSLSADQVLQNIMRQTKPGSIILQHSGGADSQDLSGTVQALTPLISKLRQAGFTFVTVPELLHVSKSK